MDRISTATKSVDLFGSGKHGFKDGNLGTGVAPTDLNAEWFNGVQEELLNVIEYASIVPAAGTRNQVRLAIQAIIAASGIQQPGEVTFFARNSAPTGYMKCNGAAVSRTTYATLFAAIGTTFGVGDGSTTFNLPELRGEFLRAWDDSRGVDSGRSFGTAQADLLKKHMHKASTVTSLGGGNIAYTPTDYGANEANPDEGVDRYSPAGNGFGTETRPRNVALLACIKY